MKPLTIPESAIGSREQLLAGLGAEGPGLDGVGTTEPGPSLPPGPDGGRTPGAQDALFDQGPGAAGRHRAQPVAEVGDQGGKAARPPLHAVGGAGQPTATGPGSPGPGSESWYLVWTKPRQEETALLQLQRQGYSCYLPRIRLQKIRKQQARVVVEPMFPRYLFVRLGSDRDSKSWSPIRSTQGVQQLIYFGGRPARVDDALVELLLEREHGLPTQMLYQPGERVQIASGPFAGIEAVFQMTDAQQRAMVLLEILGKTVPMPLETGQLRKCG